MKLISILKAFIHEIQGRKTKKVQTRRKMRSTKARSIRRLPKK